MNLRQIILSGIVVFVCLSVSMGIYLYSHPALAANNTTLLISVALPVVFSIGLLYALYTLRKIVLRRLRAEQTAAVLEKRYRTMIEDSGITIINTDEKGIIRFVSKNTIRLSGYTPQEMVGLHVTQCMPRDFRDEVNELVARAVSGGNIDETIDIQIFTKPRIDIWIGCRLYAVKDELGEVKELQFMIWDNNNHKKLELDLRVLEEARRKQQLLLQAVVDNNPNVIYIKNMKGEYVLVNRRLRELLQLPDDLNVASLKEEAVFKGNPEKQNAYKEYDRRVIEKGEIISLEESFYHPDGEKHLYVMKFPIRSDEGDIEYLCGISVDITELKNAQIEMRDAREEALQAKEAQENFLANMSHEIRTPMNGVMGMSNLLLESPLNEVQKEYVQSIKESAENLLNIINDLLDFSKIKSGKFHIDAQDFNLADTVRKAIYPLQVKAQEKNLLLNCLIDTNVPETVTGDALRLQQMIINLTANAVKFTQDGSISIKLYPVSQIGEDMVLGVDVADTGIGIAAEKLDKVFELYTQSDKNTSRVYGGTGLGLAIVKQLAELQHGTVTVKSEVGKGSVFTLHIPYKVKTQTVKKEVKQDSVQSGLLAGLKILIAEDNLINQKVVVYTLKNQGAEVSVANNGKEAVDILSNDLHHLILMDLQMPEMDGYQATRHIRGTMQSTIPIIAMTADAMKGEADKCIDAGMQDYISKPFEPKELFDKILQYASKQ